AGEFETTLAVPAVAPADMAAHVRSLHGLEVVGAGFCVEEDRIVYGAERTPWAVRSRAPPDDLVTELGRAEDGIEEDPEIVAGGRIAVQVNAAGRLQHPPQLAQARRHHRQIGKHAARADQRLKSLKHLGEMTTLRQQFCECSVCRFIPAPEITEC